MTIVESYRTLDEAARAMNTDATYLGGGTLVMRAVNEGVVSERLIRVTDPGLAQIRNSGDTITLGAGVTISQVLASRELNFLHPVARLVGGPQVRNMATVAGNLFAEHPYGDFTVALLALDARVVVAGKGRGRPIEEFLRDRDRAGLVAAIEVSRPRDPRAFVFSKISRVKPKGVSVMSIAAHVPRESGRIRGARIAFGAMGPTPLRSSGAERALEGNVMDITTIANAAATALEGLDPPSDALASAWYRREIAGVHLRRLLTEMEHR
jgi:CO/xanthine dehydrogenase FAD-binding subunit